MTSSSEFEGLKKYKFYCKYLNKSYFKIKLSFFFFLDSKYYGRNFTCITKVLESQSVSLEGLKINGLVRLWVPFLNLFYTV